MPRKKAIPTEPMSDPPVEVTESTVETTPDPVEQLPSDILTGSTPHGEGLEIPSVPSETDAETPQRKHLKMQKNRPPMMRI